MAGGSSEHSAVLLAVAVVRAGRTTQAAGKVVVKRVGDSGGYAQFQSFGLVRIMGGVFRLVLSVGTIAEVVAHRSGSLLQASTRSGSLSSVSDGDRSVDRVIGGSMFLCDKCHDASKHGSAFRSFGPCEGCGRVAACIDCHQQTCKPKPKRKDGKA
jgi:hypothetical protein